VQLLLDHWIWQGESCAFWKWCKMLYMKYIYIGKYCFSAMLVIRRHTAKHLDMNDMNSQLQSFRILYKWGVWTTAVSFPSYNRWMLNIMKYRATWVFSGWAQVKSWRQCRIYMKK
jgi:hypothetical protein